MVAQVTENGEAQYAATHRFARISARKARLVVDLIRGAPVEKALRDLETCLRRAAPMVRKVLRSAIANATQASGLEAEKLFVSRAIVNEGPTFKRWRPRAMGRAYPRTKRTCHIEITVSERDEVDETPRRVAEAVAAAAAPEAVAERKPAETGSATAEPAPSKGEKEAARPKKSADGEKKAKKAKATKKTAPAKSKKKKPTAKSAKSSKTASSKTAKSSKKSKSSGTAKKKKKKN